MQNIDELSPRPAINCYLPGLEKHFIISPAEKVTDIVCSKDWLRLLKERLATIFISFSAKCHFEATKKAVNSEIIKKKIAIKYSFERISGTLRRECILNCTHDCTFINTSIKSFFSKSRKLIIKKLNIRIKIFFFFYNALSLRNIVGPLG